MTTTQRGRARHEALFNLLNSYPMATSEQLGKLVWAGNQRLARHHLLRFVRDGQLKRLPHPLYRNGPFVYSATSARATSHSQKVLHHLAAVDLHVAVTRQLGRYGARVLPEHPWGPGLVPDQTIVWRDMVWAVEHHLNGQFNHVPDYQRFLEEEAYELCSWWRPGIRIGLLVSTTPTKTDYVAGLLRKHAPPELRWRVACAESLLRSADQWLKMPLPTQDHIV